MIARDLQETTRETDGEEERERKKGRFCAYNLVVKMGKESRAQDV